ncbi:response regulator [bacterium]|nr:response regulator [bacterium]
MTPSIVAVIDDDPAVRVAVARLLSSVGLETATYGSASDFLDQTSWEPSCLIVDVQMPGMTGIELQQALADTGHCLPIILITGHEGADPEEVGLRRGAIAFLRKPFAEEELLEALRAALPDDSF